MSRRNLSRQWPKELLFAAVLACVAAAPGPTTEPAGLDGAIVFGGDRDYPPYEFLDERGLPAGFHVDLMRAIGEVEGFRVGFSLGVWEKALRGLGDGTVTVVAVFRSAQREKGLLFAEPHSILNYEFYIRRDGPVIRSIESLKDMEVIVQAGSLIHETLQDDVVGARLVPVETEGQAAKLLASGKHDCAVLTEVGGRRAIHRHGLSNLTTSGPPVLPQEYCLAVRADNAVLLGRINKALAALKETGRYGEIYQKWLGAPEPPGVSLGQVLRYTLWTAGPLAMVAVAATTWSWSLRRKVAQRTRQLQDQLAERKRAEDALRDSEQAYRLHFTNVSDVLCSLDAQMRVVNVSPSVERILGYRPEELIGRAVLELSSLLRIDLQRILTDASRVLAGEKIDGAVYEFTARDGRVVLGEVSAAPLVREGKTIGIVLVARDVTEREGTLDALRRSEATARVLLDACPYVMLLVDDQGRLLAVNQPGEQRYGRPQAELIGKTPDELLPPDLAALRRSQFQAVLRTGQPLQSEEERDGKHWDIRACPVFDEQGRVSRLAVIVRDVTGKRLAMQVLQRSEERFRLLYEQSPLGYQSLDQHGRILDVNQAWLDLLGYPRQEVIGKWFGDLVAPEHRQRFESGFARFKTEGQVRGVEYEMMRSDGRRLTVAVDGRIGYDQEGNFQQTHCVLRDVSELRRKEEQLRQAQKMEAVGRLAGGVAHDFNNQLTVVKGYCDLLLRQLPRQDPIAESIREIQQAATRAASLTRELLAFSRKQVLRPVALNLNQVVAQMAGPLTQMIGEDVRLAVVPAADLGNVLADRLQVEQAVINLALNARDAMPDGGMLTIRTANVELDAEHLGEQIDSTLGPHVMLEVADTGVGMDPETRRHVFDPFFTTKPQGIGTGLGLAVVYGFVTQSGGHILVDSAPGKGASFRMYLPRTDAPAEDLTAQNASAPPRPGTGTVLVVEDEAGVRELVAGVLRACGYAVLEAASPTEAVLLGGHHPGTIDLIVSDIVMPEMSGEDMVAQVKSARPDVRVLFISGYAGEAKAERAKSVPGAEMLAKPFGPSELSEKVRSLLDRPRDRAS